MFHNILVPLDGSQLAEEAIPLAVRLASRSGGQITLLRAVESQLMMVPAGLEYEMTVLEDQQLQQRGHARDYLDSVRRKWMNDLAVGISAEIGSPATMILEHASKEPCDLIVMTTHGYHGLTRWMLGSVAERVLRNAPCPVVVMREDEPIQRILVPLDGSKMAEAILEHALDLAAQLGANITLLHVNDALSYADYATLDALNQFEPGLAEQLRVSHADRSASYLGDVRARHDTAVAVDAQTRLGQPADEILAAAQDGSFDLIAMSTHGRSGVRRWVYGSVTERVLRSTELPLMIVRPSDDAEPS